MRRRVRAAILFFWERRRLESYHPQGLLGGRVSWVVGGNPEMPPAEQRRRCSYRSLGRILLCFGSTPRFSCCLGDRAAGKIAIAPAMFCFGGTTAGVRCAIL